MDMIMETMGKTSGEETKEDKSMEDQRKEIENREDDEMEIDLVLLFRAFWKSFTKLWWLVLILILAGAGGFYAFQNLSYEPLYASSATFTVATGDGENGTYNFYYNSNTADQMSRTFPYIQNFDFMTFYRIFVFIHGQCSFDKIKFQQWTMFILPLFFHLL